MISHSRRSLLEKGCLLTSWARLTFSPGVYIRLAMNNRLEAITRVLAKRSRISLHECMYVLHLYELLAAPGDMSYIGAYSWRAKD
jgi:hypothetical protein